MSSTVEIIKGGGDRPSETFKRNKLYKSLVSVCMSVKIPQGQAEDIAGSVCDKVITWLKDKSEVTSNDIRTAAAKHLKKLHQEAAYLYEQHHIII
ncbi:MAG: hypothetical protein WCQ49_03345 [Candidatus Saccharibacteria bacterium]